MTGILGRKIGMTNFFDEDGRFVPVTLIAAGPCFVMGTKSKEKDGYSAVVLAYEEKKPSRTTKPLKGLYDKLKTTPKRFVREIRVEGETELKTGDIVSANLFKTGDYVDISGTTKGKGFQGGMKRWHWSGGESGHGSMFHRAPGSVGASSYPSRVHKGKHLPGHMGADKRTMQNLQIAVVDSEKNMLAVAGSVPGPNGGFLIVRQAKKKGRLNKQTKNASKAESKTAKEKGQSDKNKK